MGGRRLAILAAGVLATALAGAAAAKPQHPARRHHPTPAAEPPQAVAAERHGVPASAREGGAGYSARSRRMADCLASFRRYDPATDRIEVRPGVSRPCPLPAR